MSGVGRLGTFAMIDKDVQLAILADALTKIIDVATIGPATTTPAASSSTSRIRRLTTDCSTPKTDAARLKLPHSAAAEMNARDVAQSSITTW